MNKNESKSLINLENIVSSILIAIGIWLLYLKFTGNLSAPNFISAFYDNFPFMAPTSMSIIFISFAIFEIRSARYSYIDKEIIGFYFNSLVAITSLFFCFVNIYLAKEGLNGT